MLLGVTVFYDNNVCEGNPTNLVEHRECNNKLNKNMKTVFQRYL